MIYRIVVVSKAFGKVENPPISEPQEAEQEQPPVKEEKDNAILERGEIDSSDGGNSL